jgi:hypothetical protein
MESAENDGIDMKWVNGNTSAHLKVDLKTYNFTIKHTMEY